MSFARAAERARQLCLARQAKRAAQKVRWPQGFAGTVMWCPECYCEIHRIPDGELMAKHEQQRVVDAHRDVCVRRKMRVIR